MTAGATAAVLIRPYDVLATVRRRRFTGLPLPARWLSRARVGRRSRVEFAELVTACAPVEQRWLATGPHLVDPLLAVLPPAERVAVVAARDSARSRYSGIR